MSDYNLKGNVTTIVKFVVMSVSPALGINEATQDPLMAAIVGAAFLILAYFDAKYDNDLISQTRPLGVGSDDLRCLDDCEEYAVFGEDSTNRCEGGDDGESDKGAE